MRNISNADKVSPTYMLAVILGTWIHIQKQGEEQPKHPAAALYRAPGLRSLWLLHHASTQSSYLRLIDSHRGKEIMQTKHTHYVVLVVKYSVKQRSFAMRRNGT